MDKKRIFVTDLDGTFVKDSRNVSPLDRESLAVLKQEMPIAIATGRSVKEIHYIEEQINLNCDIRIGFNGGIIEVNGQRIFEQSIEPSVLVKVLDFIQSNQIVFDALDGEQRIGTHKTDDFAKLWNMELVEPPHLFEFLKQKKIYKMNIRPKLGETDELLSELQEKFPQLSICKSGEKRIEITPPNITKGHALEMLKRQYGTTFISVGDSENDISMFKESSQSFCMAHAATMVKEEATDIVENFYEVIDLIA